MSLLEMCGNSFIANENIGILIRCSSSEMGSSGVTAESTRRPVVELNGIERVLFIPGPPESLRSSFVRVDRLRSTPAGFGKFLLLICFPCRTQERFIWLFFSFFFTASLTCFSQLGLTLEPSRWPSLGEGSRGCVCFYFVICHLCF